MRKRKGKGKVKREARSDSAMTSKSHRLTSFSSKSSRRQQGIEKKRGGRAHKKGGKGKRRGEKKRRAAPASSRAGIFSHTLLLHPSSSAYRPSEAGEIEKGTTAEEKRREEDPAARRDLRLRALFMSRLAHSQSPTPSVTEAERQRGALSEGGEGGEGRKKRGGGRREKKDPAAAETKTVLSCF